jgi:hypothetical protein
LSSRDPLFWFPLLSPVFVCTDTQPRVQGGDNGKSHVRERPAHPGWFPADTEHRRPCLVWPVTEAAVRWAGLVEPASCLTYRY